MLTAAKYNSTLPDNSAAGFSRIDFSSHPTVIAAVSGGSDSTALVYLAAKYIEDHKLPVVLKVATVDHRLRAGAREEAVAVSDMCASLNISHVIKVWNGAKPKSGIQEAARMARYKLLHEAALEAGASLVLTGHTSNDQCETLAMRRRRGGGRGLSGIAPATLYGRQTWFARPLLSCSRRSLRGGLEDRGISWINDPTNDDSKFERVRIRKSLENESSPIEAHDWACAEQSRRFITSQEAARQIADSDCLAALTPDQAVIGGRDMCHLALSAIASFIGRKEHFPAHPVGDKIKEFVANSGNGTALTAHGCRFHCKTGSIIVTREQRNNGKGRFGLDVILPSFDFPIAAAIDRRLGRASAPLPPFIPNL